MIFQRYHGSAGWFLMEMNRFNHRPEGWIVFSDGDLSAQAYTNDLSGTALQRLVEWFDGSDVDVVVEGDFLYL
jgi:hypothetical protein